ncbi:axin-2-like [Scleropages formosus]|uniref:Axin-2-like n=1 Tax=Scleropages formosus TaxID=113540 RepID=A0A0P7V631_SCLFO|nr:axin-2-like [Scleropages formosus]
MLAAAAAATTVAATPGAPGSAARRNEDGLGEPEGSASPDSPLARWTKSLLSLLGDQDGAHLFRTFLEREKCVDTVDFWFACNGFRQMSLKEAKTARVAKAIYKRYVEGSGVVAQRLKPATKAYIRDSIKRQHLDSSMFDQAQTEVQAAMEESAYHTFLASDIYVEYARAGCESPVHAAAPADFAGLRLVCGYLPTLMEEEELYRHSGDQMKSCHINTGHVFAPASSANDSEVSSDALTDDSMSVTDGSVDGIPSYKLGARKLLQREMHRNMKINGQVSLPHFPRTHRPPRDVAPVEPAVFAAELIARLESLQREQEARSSLEERLQQIQEEEERDESEVSGSSSHSILPPSACEEDPQAILDEHLSRVLKTPGCQSPGAVRHHSPDPWGSRGQGFAMGKSPRHAHHHPHRHAQQQDVLRARDQAAEGAETARHMLGLCSCPRGSGLGSPAEGQRGRYSTLPKRPHKTDEGLTQANIEGEGCAGGAPLQPPTEGADRSQSVLQWILESEKQARHRSQSTQGTRKPHAGESLHLRTHSWGGGGGHPRTVQPSQPFVQDPAMPPLPPPNTLAQLEEACRRLEEVSKLPKTRYSTPGFPRERSQPASIQNGTSLSSSQPAAEDCVILLDRACHMLVLTPLNWVNIHRSREPRKTAAPQGYPSSELIVTYFFCGEEIPYRRMMKTHSLTLGHFKEQLRKKGSYRYYFKKASDEFECGAVFEEVWDDSAVLPMYEGKILGKVERMD